MTKVAQRGVPIGLAAGAALLVVVPTACSRTSIDDPPSGFVSGKAEGLHYVRGGKGPVVILLHGYPENWAEYRDIMPRLAKRFTVVSVDLPGIGKSDPSTNGYEAANLATRIHSLAQSLKLKHAYVAGHDLGAIVTYAYVRKYPDALRGAMILDVPVPGIAGWDEAISGLWLIGFAQAPKGLAEKLVTGRQSDFVGFALDIGKFAPEKRDYYYHAYGDPQLHAAFEIYRAFPKSGEFNEAQTTPNSTPLVVAVGEKSFFAEFLPTFVDGYRAKGMERVEAAHIPGSSHYVLADNPDAVASLIERHAGQPA